MTVTWTCWQCRQTALQKARKPSLRVQHPGSPRAARLLSNATRPSTFGGASVNSKTKKSRFENDASHSEHGTARTGRPIFDSKVAYDDVKSENAPDLPRPPFMRKGKPSERFDWVPNTGPYMASHSKTQRVKRKLAPFATAFFQNPYARMLASPVRECTFTGARVPRALMLDFHLVEAGDPLGAASLGGRKQMLPLSLAARLVPNKKKEEDQTEAEKEAVRRWNEEKDKWQVPAAACYMTTQQAAVEYVSKEPARHVKHLAMSARTRHTLEKEGSKATGWRTDMPTIVLEGYRRLLWRKLGFFIRQKTSHADTPGVLQALPTDGGLGRLHEMPDVGCVIRFTPSDELMPAKDHTLSREAKRMISDDDSSELSLENEPVDLPATETEQATSSMDAEEDAAMGFQASDGETAMIGSQTHQELDDPRVVRQLTKHVPYLADIRPLHPPHRPAELYFPTVRYRNQRVPIYSLPVLLGEKICAELLKGTVFEHTKYAALQQRAPTCESQETLLKLQAYLAKSKQETLKL